MKRVVARPKWKWKWLTVILVAYVVLVAGVLALGIALRWW